MAIVDKRPDALEASTPVRPAPPRIEKADFDAHLREPSVAERLARVQALAKERKGHGQAAPPTQV